MSIKANNNKRGFTMVELMLALAFFSFILMFVLSGFLLITRNYNQGVTSNRVHQTGRNLMERMVREFRQSDSEVKTYSTGTEKYLCYSDGTYLSYDDTPTNDSRSGSLRRTDQDLTANCDSSLDDGSMFDSSSSEAVLTQTDLVSVTNIELSELSSGLYRLEMSLSSTNFLFESGEFATDADGDGEDDICTIATTGVEYCDVVTLSTVFTTR